MPDRLHPAAGQGLSAGQRAIARLGLGRAHAGGDARRSSRSRRTDQGVATRVGIAGQSLLLSANGSNFGSMFVMLETFDERHGRTERRRASPPSCASAAGKKSARRRCRVFGAAAGRRPGHRRRLQADGRGPRQPGPGRLCSEQPTDLVERGNARPAWTGLFTMFRANTPQLYLDIDRTKCQADGRGARATSSTRCRSTWARCTSTTSTSSAAPGRSTSRPTPHFRNRVDDIEPAARSATPRGRWCRWARWLNVRDISGPVDGHALQHVLRPPPSTATPRPGISSGQAIAHDGSTSPTSDAAAGRWPTNGPS